jgi:hypothetical protein
MIRIIVDIESPKFHDLCARCSQSVQQWASSIIARKDDALAPDPTAIINLAGAMPISGGD